MHMYVQVWTAQKPQGANETRRKSLNVLTLSNPDFRKTSGYHNESGARRLAFQRTYVSLLVLPVQTE